MHKKANGGFTLIEVMIAIGVLSIGLLALASMQITAVKGNSHSNRVTSATNLAQDKIEYLMSLPYNHPDLKDQDDDDDNVDEGLDDIKGNADYRDQHDLFNVFWNISVDSTIKNTKTIRVIVTCDSDQTIIWDKTLGRRSNVSIDYIKAQ